MIEQGRIEVHCVSEKKKDAAYVLYWMQQSQRVSYNHALNYAIEQANAYDVPLLVVFCITPDYVDANARHYQFMLEGLNEVARRLSNLRIGFVLETSHPVSGIQKYMEKTELLVMDKGYLHIQRKWREEVLQASRKCRDISVVEVDTDLIVPVESASDKAEHAARTIRPKLWRQYPNFDHTPGSYIVNKPWENRLLQGLRICNQTQLLMEQEYDQLMQSLGVEFSIAPSKLYHGGYTQAVRVIEEFFENRLNAYKDPSPVARNTSRIGMYLHFGQISSLEVLKRLYAYVSIQKQKKNALDQESVDGFIEQIFIRRELAYNYVFYTQGYDQFEAMTDPWAYQTMAQHIHDAREYIYTLDELIACQTHDVYWNDAMREMVETGYMHNYMRMYWCKKILEWSPSYAQAYANAIYLNNRYFIDGRDPNGYAGVAWCFGKHDHGWKERPVFGKLRYMNANGLKRKFKM